MATNSQGSTAYFVTSQFTANLQSIEFGEIKRDSLDTTNLSTTTARTSQPTTLYDPGELTLKVLWTPSAAATPPYASAAETVYVQFGATAAAGTPAVSFSAYVVGWKITSETDDLIQADVKCKVSGALIFGKTWNVSGFSGVAWS